MSLTWTREAPSVWTEAMCAVLGDAPAGALPAYDMQVGAAAPGEWWRVERDGAVVGFGWMDVVWGDAEILLAVAAGAQGTGVGTFILERLEDEARKRGLRHILNVVPKSHPERQKIKGWLSKRGFAGGHDHEQLRRVVPRV